jgi:hypothetical protein
LQFDRNVLHDVAEPGALVIVKATDETARLSVRATMFVQSGQVVEQWRDEFLTELSRRPVF